MKNMYLDKHVVVVPLPHLASDLTLWPALHPLCSGAIQYMFVEPSGLHREFGLNYQFHGGGSRCHLVIPDCCLHYLAFNSPWFGIQANLDLRTHDRYRPICSDTSIVCILHFMFSIFKGSSFWQKKYSSI